MPWNMEKEAKICSDVGGVEVIPQLIIFITVIAG